MDSKCVGSVKGNSSEVLATAVRSFPPLRDR
jgi:hypothetical protein